MALRLAIRFRSSGWGVRVLVAEDLTAPLRERRLAPWWDGRGDGATPDEHRLLTVPRPTLPWLNWVGTFAKTLLKVPRLG